MYLHDSPAKALFEQDTRLFSSGCIRVQKAFELAELVLNDPVKWNQAAMDAVVATEKTQTVNLAKPVPVLILYWTAQPRADGQVIFRNDVYQRDPATLAALNSDFRLPHRRELPLSGSNRLSVSRGGARPCRARGRGRVLPRTGRALP